MFQGAGLVSWQLVYTKQAQKDAKKLAAAGLKEKAQACNFSLSCGTAS